MNNKLFHTAKKFLVAGVNSPVRSFQAVGRMPIFIHSGKGAKIYSADGQEFIDYCQSFGALILGHAHPVVIAELKKAIHQGVSFGAATKLETELAKVILDAVPSIEKIRFTNSGTEAVMTAVRLARAYTGKNKIIKFKGSYHGHADYLLDCPGVPEAFKKYTLVAPYNNIEGLKTLLRQQKGEIAAIIVEPVAANMGVVLPKADFLPQLKKITKKNNLLLIFDEVITGFRLGLGGAQEFFGVKPDLTCLGKIIGGGLPVGAVGGREEIMRLLAPQGQVYQAGTFSGNPLTMSAGLATLKKLAQDKPYAGLEKITRQLCQDISSLARDYGIKLRVNFIASLFSLFFTDRDINNYGSARTQDKDFFSRFYRGLLKEGVYFSPSGGEANFISTAHTREDIAQTIRKIEKTFRTLRRG